MKMKIAVVAVGALLLAAVPILAHHSFSAEYDQSKPLTLKGKFTKLDALVSCVVLQLNF